MSSPYINEMRERLSDWSGYSDWSVDKLRAGLLRCRWHRADVAARACQKDRQAFTLLYEYYKQPLGKRLMHLVNNQETVNDLYQETFLRAGLKATPAVAGYFELWLYHVARNLAVDYVRHEMRLEFVPLTSDESREGELHPLVASTICTGLFEDQAVDRLLLQEALANMSPKYHVCLVLYWHWGFKHKEIAERLDISEKTVSANVSQACKQLEKLYKKIESRSQKMQVMVPYPEQIHNRNKALERPLHRPDFGEET